MPILTLAHLRLSLSAHIEFDLPALLHELIHGALQGGDLRLERGFLIPELGELLALPGDGHPHGEHQTRTARGDQREVLPSDPGRSPPEFGFDAGGARRYLV